MDLGLKNRVAIVTGGSKGLGQAEADQVVRGLQERGCRAVSVQADVSQTADVLRLMETTLKTFG